METPIFEISTELNVLIDGKITKCKIIEVNGKYTIREGYIFSGVEYRLKPIGYKNTLSYPIALKQHELLELIS